MHYMSNKKEQKEDLQTAVWKGKTNKDKNIVVV